MSNKHNKLIIENRANLNDATIMRKILAVINMGKISRQSKGMDCYCFHTGFEDDTEVYYIKNKKSDRFVVTHSSNKQNK